nr:hypothetical protein [Iodidimonas gelatinilytica]
MSLSPDFFFQHSGMDADTVTRLLDNSLHGLDDGELFLEYSQSEALLLDDGRLKSASFDTNQALVCVVSAGKPPAMPMPLNCPKPPLPAPPKR